MYFITDRYFYEGNLPGNPHDPDQQLTDAGPRIVSFDNENGKSRGGISFGKYYGKDDVQEIRCAQFFRDLQSLPSSRILLYIHGMRNLPEETAEAGIFRDAQKLQDFFNETAPSTVQNYALLHPPQPSLETTEALNNLESNPTIDSHVEVVPIVWACHKSSHVAVDFFRNQNAADTSGTTSIKYLLEYYHDWKTKMEAENPSFPFKMISILAHSMGNRVIQKASLAFYKEKIEGKGIKVPQLFESLILSAADLANESLEGENEASVLPKLAKRVNVYCAENDRALAMSVTGNITRGIFSRRLGQSGPENVKNLPENVRAFDCSAINFLYGDPKGHTYFLEDLQGKPGALFKHFAYTILTEDVDIKDEIREEYEPPDVSLLYLLFTGIRDNIFAFAGVFIDLLPLKADSKPMAVVDPPAAIPQATI